MMQSIETPIQKAIRLVGAAKLAAAIGISRQFMSQIGAGHRPVPASRCLAIETATGGQVTRHDLRPDVFGAAPAKAA